MTASLSTAHGKVAGRLTDQPKNRLADTTSPYLQQHATNPVAWWPWCDEALTSAREQDKPILLSVGYSACHWCHVMAHESFEDAATAEVMNRLFVNVKVDREERPDIDRIYQTAHQLLAQRPGGWPLTIFLTPDDLRPFFAGTYFPREERHGLPPFTQIIASVERAYREQRDAIRDQNASLLDALKQLEPTPADVVPDAAPLEGARRQFAGSFDAANGGFGKAPKFPHPTNMEFLFRHWAATAVIGPMDTTADVSTGGAAAKPRKRHGSARDDGDVKALQMANFTLARIIRGGINDQLRGGFCRYSVDDQWMIPHFEKMLYDNGPLLALCCDASQASDQIGGVGGERLADATLFRNAAIATADWVIAEMQSLEGGYFSSIDADSEGQEGRYYVWERAELAGLLDDAEYALIAPLYGLDQTPNFEGKWHLYGYRTLADVAAEQGLSLMTARAMRDRAKAKLLAARERRVRPGRDEKVLTSWNALMIKGMARAARVLDRADYLASAERALAFIRGTLWHNGRLLATYKDGRAHLNAYLDDYALLLDALLEMLQTRWSRTDLDLAVALADVLLAQFFDAGRGGFYFTAADHEPLIQRPKPLGDEAMPSGNGVAARALQRLGHLLGATRYLDAVQATLRFAAEPMRRIPYAHASLLMALDEYLQPAETIVIRGAGMELAAWQAAAQRGYRPRRIVLAIPADEPELPGTLAAMRPGDTIVAYCCRGTRCEAPITSVDALVDA